MRVMSHLDRLGGERHPGLSRFAQDAAFVAEPNRSKQGSGRPRGGWAGHGTAPGHAASSPRNAVAIQFAFIPRRTWAVSPVGNSGLWMLGRSSDSTELRFVGHVQYSRLLEINAIFSDPRLDPLIEGI